MVRNVVGPMPSGPSRGNMGTIAAGIYANTDAPTFHTLRRDVLEELNQEAEETSFDLRIRRAANAVSAALNNGPSLEELAVEAALSFDTPEITEDTNAVVNPNLSWYGDAESWHPINLEPWAAIRQDGLEVERHQATFDGEPWSGQTGVGMNAGYRSYHTWGVESLYRLGYEYVQQTIQVRPGIEYTIEANMTVRGYADAFQFSGLNTLSLSSPAGYFIEIEEQTDTEFPYLADGATAELLPKIRFKVVLPAGDSASFVSIEVRAGFNTDNEFIQMESGDTAHADYTLTSVISYVTDERPILDYIYTATLPDDCRHVKWIKLGDRYAWSLEQYSDRPRYRARYSFTRTGKTIRFNQPIPRDPAPSGIVKYIPDIPPISDNDKEEHVGIRIYAEAYFHGCCAALATHLYDPEARDMHQQEYIQAMALIIDNVNRQQQQSTGYPRVRHR